MALDVLKKVGVSPGEVRVYSVLLDSGQNSVNGIHEKTGIERRNIYDILNKLIERGLVTYIVENKKRLFQVSDPQKIIDYIADEKRELEKVEQEIQKELPRLSKQYHLRLPDVFAQVYRGDEGIKAVWEDMLNYDAVYWIGSGRYIPKRFPSWFANWNRRRIQKGVKWVNLLRAEMRKEVKKPYMLEELKFLPSEFSGNPVVVAVFGSKVINFLFGRQLFALMMQSEELAANYKRYHRVLWDKVAKN